MATVELVVAEGRDDERWKRLDPTPDDPQDVERRLVGPVQVLNDDDGGGGPPELAHQRGGELVRPDAARRSSLELAARRLGDVEERPKRTRCEERVARAPQNTHRTLVVAEPSRECRLSHPGLSSHEHEPAVSGRNDGSKRVRKRRELIGALEQLADALRPRCRSGFHDRRAFAPVRESCAPEPGSSSSFARDGTRTAPGHVATRRLRAPTRHSRGACRTWGPVH